MVVFWVETNKTKKTPSQHSLTTITKENYTSRTYFSQVSTTAPWSRADKNLGSQLLKPVKTVVKGNDFFFSTAERAMKHGRSSGYIRNYSQKECLPHMQNREPNTTKTTQHKTVVKGNEDSVMQETSDPCLPKPVSKNDTKTAPKEPDDVEMGEREPGIPSVTAKVCHFPSHSSQTDIFAKLMMRRWLTLHATCPNGVTLMSLLMLN